MTQKILFSVHELQAAATDEDLLVVDCRTKRQSTTSKSSSVAAACSSWTENNIFWVMAGLSLEIFQTASKVQQNSRRNTPNSVTLPNQRRNHGQLPIML